MIVFSDKGDQRSPFEARLIAWPHRSGINSCGRKQWDIVSKRAGVRGCRNAFWCTKGSTKSKTKHKQALTLLVPLPAVVASPSQPPSNPFSKILIGERCVLHTLGFQLTVQHPYSGVMALLKRLHTLGRGADGGKGVNKTLNRQLRQVCTHARHGGGSVFAVVCIVLGLFAVVF